MVLDEETLERMLAAGKTARRTEQPPSRLMDATDEFEVYERAAPEDVTESRQEAPHEDLAEYPPRRHPKAAPPPAQDAGAAPEPAGAGDGPHLGPPGTGTPEPPHGAEAGAASSPVAPALRPTPPRPQVFAPQSAPARAAPPPPAQAPTPRGGAATAVDRPTAGLSQTTPGAAAGTGRPSPGGDAPRIGLVQSDFNSDVTDLMARWALQHAQKNGAAVTRHVHVPGVFDVPLTAKLLARCDDVDCIVVVGAVVQGETAHDSLITRETARLLADIAYHFEKPVGLGIAGPGMTMKQAEARMHMGRDAVASVLQQWQALRGLRA